MSTDPTSLLPVRYYGSDPETIEQEILDELRASYGEDFTNIIQSSHGMMLIHLYSRALWRVVFQGDRNASDVYAHTVRMRTPSAWIAKQLGYSPRGAAPAATALVVTPDAAQAFDVIMPAGFVFKAADGSLWRTSKDYQWDANDATAKSISVREFEAKGTTFTSNGQAHQRFKMPIDRTNPTYIVDGSVVVKVAGVVWTAKSIIPWGAGNNYEVFYTADVPFVMFGDGSAGSIPPQGATVRVDWEQCRGLKGNIGKGNITSTQAALVSNGVSIGLTVTQPSAAGGGLPDETAQEAARSAVTALQTRGGAVTRGDIEAQALAFVSSRYGRAARATAYSPRGGGNDAVLAAALKGVRDQVGTPVPAVQAATTALGAVETAADGFRGDAYSDLSTVSLAVDNLDANLADAILDLDAGDTEQTAADEAISQLGGHRVSLTAAITAIPDTGASDELTVATKATLLALTTLINDRKADAATAVGNLKTVLGDVRGEIVSAQAYSGFAKTTADNGKAVLLITGPLYLELAKITAQTSAINAAVIAVNDTIEPYLQAIYDHVDTILAADAQANVVQVPILAKDQDGFLTAPSVGLTKAVESHLLSLAEPTVSIQVADGSPSLLVPTIKAYGWFSRESVETEVEADIQSAVDQFVQEATFGTDLCLRDLYEMTRSIEDLVKVTFEITGPTKYLDSVGNLSVPPTMILTRTTVDTAGLVEEPTT